MKNPIRFRCLFRAQERLYILAHGPQCGWLVSDTSVFTSRPDGFRQRGWPEIVLEGAPAEAVLNQLAERGILWDQSLLWEERAKVRDDSPERAFVVAHAREALGLCQEAYQNPGAPEPALLFESMGEGVMNPTWHP